MNQQNNTLLYWIVEWKSFIRDYKGVVILNELNSDLISIYEFTDEEVYIVSIKDTRIIKIRPGKLEYANYLKKISKVSDENSTKNSDDKDEDDEDDDDQDEDDDEEENSIDIIHKESLDKEDSSDIESSSLSSASSSSSYSDDESDSDSSNSIDNKVQLKVEVKNEIRGFSVYSNRQGYKKLISLLTKAYGSKPSKLIFVDNDGDKITILASSDFMYAIKTHKAAIVSNDNNLPKRENKTMTILRLIAEFNLEIKDNNQQTSYFVSSSDENINLKTDKFALNEVIWQRGELIGAGSFGNVYSGIDLKSGMKIAVKEVLIGNHKRHIEQIKALQKEVTILSALIHPNIIRYIGTEKLDSGIRIFLELAPEGSVKDMLNEFGELSEPIIRRYTIDIINGLSFLHSQGYTHRDIKPSNLLVMNGIIKLADFGCSSNTTLGNDTESAHCTMAGTVIYMSPECMNSSNNIEEDLPDIKYNMNNNIIDNKDFKERRRYGKKTDIWSLGITLVELSTGKPPFRNAAGAIYSVLVTKSYPKFPIKLSDDAHTFLEKCLEPNPKFRADCNELKQHPFLNFTSDEKIKTMHLIPSNLIELSRSSSSSQVSFSTLVNENDRGFDFNFNIRASTAICTNFDNTISLDNNSFIKERPHTSSEIIKRSDKKKKKILLSPIVMSPRTSEFEKFNIEPNRKESFNAENKKDDDNTDDSNFSDFFLSKKETPKEIEKNLNSNNEEDNFLSLFHS